MAKRKKPIYKTLWFWQVILGLVVVLGVCIALLVSLSDGIVAPPPAEPEVTDPPAVTTVPTTVPQETILPENPYGPLDFVYENDYLTCTAGEAVLGIDVSTWQGRIDWQEVKDAGIEFAMIRVGYRGIKDGELDEDDWAQANYAGASAAGVKVGAYFFSQAISVEEAREEAGYVLDLVKDWNIEMPIVFDWEFVSDTARTARMNPRLLTDCTKAFCEVIEDAGYEAMIYFNSDMSKKEMYLEELVDYGFWLAMYDQVMNYPHRVDMWQYSDSGAVPGISGNVDMNLMFKYE